MLVTLLFILCFSIVLWFPFYENGLGKSDVLKLPSDKFSPAYGDTNILKSYAPLLKRKSLLSSYQNFADNLNKYETCLLNQGIKIFLLWIDLFIWNIHTFRHTFQLPNLLLSQGWNVEVYKLYFYGSSATCSWHCCRTCSLTLSCFCFGFL